MTNRTGAGARWLGVALVAVLAGSLPAVAPPRAGPPQQLRVEVLATYPHDREAWTQGLEMHDGQLFESTGLYGRSDVRVSDVDSGEILRLVRLPDWAFGEGLTVVGDTVWQLTWQEQVAFVRDRETLAELDQRRYDGEGWGLCYDDRADLLVMSDGTSQLTFRDPVTFEARDAVHVRQEGQPLDMINELECVDGKVWANLWQTDHIVRINPANGRVEAVVDAAGLLTEEELADADVLNGIAAVPGTDTFLITGKLWPTVFLVRFVPAD